MGHSQNATNICYSDLHLHGEGKNEKEANVRFSLGFKVIYYEYVNILKPEAFASQAFQAGGLHPTTCEPFSRGQASAGSLPTAVGTKLLLRKIKIITICVCMCAGTCSCVWVPVGPEDSQPRVLSPGHCPL